MKKGGTLPIVKNPAKRLIRWHRVQKLRRVETKIVSLNELLGSIEYSVWPEYYDEVEAERNRYLHSRNNLIKEIN